ncbi:MAG: Sec-independent protein translocase TatB [Micrococcales bacterium]
MFGLSTEKFLILLVLAALVLGPERLPSYAKWLADFAKKVRKFATETRNQLEQETGEDLGEIDWKKLDPRQYDPRRIIRDALLEEDNPRESVGLKPRAEALAANAPKPRIKTGEKPPFDNEAT